MVTLHLSYRHPLTFIECQNLLQAREEEAAINPLYANMPSNVIGPAPGEEVSRFPKNRNCEP